MLCQTNLTWEYEKDLNLGSINKKIQRCSTNLKYYNNIEINGTQYNIGTYIVTSISDVEKTFGEIINIVSEEDKIYFVVDEYEELIFDDHFYAYEVYKKNEGAKTINIEELLPLPPCLSLKLNDNHYLATRYML